MNKRNLLAMATLLALTMIAIASLAQQSATKPTTSKDKMSMGREKTPPAKPATAKATPKKETKNAFTPDAIQWGPAPPFVPAGAKLAVLEGNPMGTGFYVVRLKMPDGYKVAPHWHPERENVTVISGTLKVGMGDKWDDAKMSLFPAGSFAYLDPSMHHYAGTSGDTTIQISGKGPVKFNYVDAKDDPSKAQSTTKKK